MRHQPEGCHDKNTAAVRSHVDRPGEAHREVQMKILLLGANGRTGRQVLARALRDGDTLTAIVRAPDRLADITHERLRVCVANPCDPGALEQLLPGHDAVISVLGPRWPTRAASAIYYESAAAIVEAMHRAKVTRLLVTSSALLFPDDGLLARVLQFLVPRIVEAAGRMETQICASDLDWTVARTGFLTSDDKADYNAARDAMPDGAGSIPRAAVARFLLEEAKQHHHLRQVVGLSG